MTTLAVRLAGPTQSWGENARFNTRPTLDTPTRAGLIGLARAALGHGRYSPFSDIEWLLALDMAVRVDSRGVLLRDFQTVNPRKAVLPAGASLAKQEHASLGTVPTGSGKQWAISGKAQTLLTERYYRQDASYLWLIEGPSSHIDRLVHAFAAPAWALSLGRKSCVPDWLFTLAALDTDPVTAATEVPRIIRAHQADTPVDLVLMTHGLVTRHPEATPADPVADTPAGSHPNDGYLYGVRATLTVQPPATDRAGLIAWTQQNGDPR